MAYERSKVVPDWLALWILFAAWSSLSGWCLSALGRLNVAGIASSYALFIGVLIVCRFHLYTDKSISLCRIFRTRYPAPKIWLLLVILAFIGGVAYSPNNYDYLTYRFPRVLSWSWGQAWYWVPTVNPRINYSGTGFEWLMVPLFIVFKTDRLFFLINFISYLFLPVLVFSVFSHLGISKRICWWWMLVLPSGYCYIIQAASAGNDSFAAVYFLASLHYLFQAKAPHSIKNLALSCLAIALMTGAKAANLPLVLPWLTALFLQRRLFLETVRPVAIALILIVSAAVSFLPTALLNIHFTGDFAGDPKNRQGMKISNPLIGIVGNSLQIAENNLVPPVLPQSLNWSFMMPSWLKADLRSDFPRFDFESSELQIEEGAGPGLGIILFAGLFVLKGVGARFTDSGIIVKGNRQALYIGGAMVVALLVYMSKMGSESTSRLIAAYYPGLIAAILTAASLDGRIVRRGPFRWIPYLSMLSAIPLLILSPARPLFPVQLTADIISKSHFPANFVTRYNDVYGVYAARSDVYKDLLLSIPPGERAIGFLQIGNDSEAPLWRPFGSRRVIEVTALDSREEVEAQGVHFIVVGEDALTNTYHTNLNSVMAKWSASLVSENKITLTANRGPERWYVLRL